MVACHCTGVEFASVILGYPERFTMHVKYKTFVGQMYYISVIYVCAWQVYIAYAIMHLYCEGKISLLSIILNRQEICVVL